MRKNIFVILLIATLPIFSYATVDDQKLVGQGKLNYYFWHIYDASLYSANGEFSFDKPFALKLDYKRKLYGDKIADRSAEEIKQLGFDDDSKLAAWRAQMKDIFPDVDDGTSITGYYTPDKPTVFYKNNKKAGVIQDPEFGEWFFGIWLDKNTSEPKLRKALLGGK